MAVTVADSGTLTTNGTEQTLSSLPLSGVFQLDVDCGNMANGDVVEVRLKKPVLNGGTTRVVWRSTVGPSARSESILSSPPIVCPFGYTLTIKQVAGTLRSYDWSVAQLS